MGKPRPLDIDKMRRRIRRLRVILVIEIILILISLWLFWPRDIQDPSLTHSLFSQLISCTQLPFDDNHGITVSQPVGTAEYTGISDGHFAFDEDVVRPDVDAKCQATQALKNSSQDALNDWNNVHAMDSNDAEALIYQEDLKVLRAQEPHITIIVGSILTGRDASIGRSFLQGVAVAQYQHNRNHGSPQIYLVVANFSSMVKEDAARGPEVEKNVVTQIANLVKEDSQAKTSYTLNIKGIVIGLPFILSQDIMQQLDQIGVPIVLSGGFSEKQLMGTRNIFPVAASTDREGEVGARYVNAKFPNSKIAVFADKADPYGQSLTDAFQQHFPSSSIIPEQYTLSDNEQDFLNKLHDVEDKKANLIYFAGSSSDLNKLVNNLLSGATNLPIVGGDALYELGGYTGKNYSQLHFTAFAFPDEWKPPTPYSTPPSVTAFLQEYPDLFAGSQSAGASSPVYGYVRPDSDTLLSNDALSVLLKGVDDTVSSNGNGADFSSQNLIQTLRSFSGQQAFQGFSGRISFDTNRNHAQKAVLMLYVNDQGLTQMLQLPDGCLLPSSSC